MLKKIFANKNVLTMMSILSVLLAFALVCALCLFAMDRLGIVKLSFSASQETGGVSAETDFPLPAHTAKTPSVSAVTGGISVFETVIEDIPFSDSYYIKMQISADQTAGDDLPEPGTYEIWRYGDKYKIHRYNSNYETEMVITCDGTRLWVIDYLNTSSMYYNVSDGYTFEKVAPYPDFHFLSDVEYEIFEYSESGDICSAALEYASLSTVDNIVFSMSTGMLHSFSRYHAGRIIWKIDMLSFDLDFDFMDYMFSIN